ncbi:MAG: hypothetical protein CMF74_11235 [Maricaulis sp.]|jgi:hypothetical protein|nr:hypothetical protein [Maricaulis sp.]HAQ36734.1 hypothetical protein [Alphaproteobacteria bacterium]|tara:strand:+ start:1655 stop:2038 length:384 start_codon:yes stop_codon:yes gene_type:complete
MQNKEDVESLEKIIGQLQGLHSEISVLAKKSPSDAVNAFKLKLINNVIAAANEVLYPNYLPFGDFTSFEADDVPSTSDVTLVLSQYMEEAERYRSDNVRFSGGVWVYVVNGEPSGIRSGPPTKVMKK